MLPHLFFAELKALACGKKPPSQDPRHGPSGGPHSSARWRRLGAWLGALPALALSTHATAAANAAPYPQGLTMPWRTPGIDLAEIGQVRAALEQASKALAAAWLKAPQPLPVILGNARPLTLSTKREGQKILAGDQTAPVGELPLTIEPIWCRLMDRQVVMVTVAQSKTNELMGSAHSTVTLDQWQAQRDADGLGTLLSSQITTLARQALDQAQKKIAQALAGNTLHVGLSLERHATRVDEGSSHCLSLLLEEKLANTAEGNFTVARSLGLDQLALVRNILGQDPPTLRRPTRVLVLGWQLPSSKESRPKTFPFNLDLIIRPLESVFAHSIPKARTKDQVTLTVDQPGRVTISGLTQLSAFLDQERRSLLTTDWPRAARIERAWVYLDRGRAWGLKMNDRLVSGSGPDEIKGHVVRFFGPEENLTSPRGFPINEGAILYIRKNQKGPQIGSEFRLDPKTFPTPWPPPSPQTKP